MGRGASTAELIDLKRRPKSTQPKSARTKPERAKPKGTRPRRTKPGVLERELLSTRRTLRVFDDFIELADSLPEDIGEVARKKAWRAVDDADPIRILIAEQLLGVSGQTVREWIDRDVLERTGDSPVKVTLASVLEVKDIVDELREQGQDRDLVNAVLNKLELEELGESDRFRKSLEQMKRGERGEWPADFDV